jgi:hypothetical protein
MFAKYNIKDIESFDKHHYPDVVMEIAKLQQVSLVSKAFTRPK